MAYTGGLYTGASQASAAEAQRFRQFQTQIDEMSARERAAALRQQQAAMDRQMAGLVQPGQTPEFRPVQQAPITEQYPTRKGLPPQATPEQLTAAPDVGLSSYPSEGMSPGLSVSGVGSGQKRLTIEEFVLLPAAEKMRLYKEYNANRSEGYSDPSGAFTVPAEPQLTFEEFVKTFPTREQQAAGLSVVREGKGDFAPAAPGAAAPDQTQAIPEPDSMGVTNVSAPVPAALAPAKESLLKDPAAQAESTRKYESLSKRTEQVPSVVASARGQRTIRRSLELGADPAAVLALSGVETEFGKNIAVDPTTGAAGLMQVTPATFKEMKDFFTNPDVIKQYKLSPAVVDAATNMTPGSEDAGILRVLYNDLIGVPKNLWGAAYFGSAEDVKKAGRPLAVTDSNGISQADYNKAYIDIYNEARNYVGISSKVTPNAIPTATYNLEQLDRKVQAEQLQYETEFAALKAEYDRTAAERNRVVQQITMAQQNGYNNLIPDLQRQLDRLDTLIYDINTRATTRNSTYQTANEQNNLARLNEFATIAVFNMRNGEGGALSEMWSRATQSDIQLEYTGADSYNIFINGELDQANVPTATIEGMFMNNFSQAYRERQAALKEKIAEQKFKADQEVVLENMRQVGAITKEKIQYAFPQWGELKENQDAEGNTIGYTAIDKNSGKFIIMRIKPGVEVKPGLNTADDYTVTVRDAPGLTGAAQ